MSLWNDFLGKLESAVVSAAQSAFGGFVNEAKMDAQSFVATIETDLKTWTQQLANGQIDKADFADFVRADADLAKLAALTAAGIAETDLQRFRDALIQAVIDAAAATFKL